MREVIFKSLGEKSLANCVEVNKNWQSAIGNEKVYLKKKIQRWSKNSEQFSKEWSEALVKTPLELLGRLSEYIMEHKSYPDICDYKPIQNGDENGKWSPCCECLVYYPIHIAALHGDIDLVKHIELRTKNQNPETGYERNPFHLAAFQGNLEICKWYITNIGEVDNIDELGWTALHFASEKGELETVKFGNG